MGEESFHPSLHTSVFSLLPKPWISTFRQTQLRGIYTYKERRAARGTEPSCAGGDTLLVPGRGRGITQSVSVQSLTDRRSTSDTPQQKLLLKSSEATW